MIKKFIASICLLPGLIISVDADLVFFETRAAFDLAAPGIPVEDFENLTGAVSGGGVDVLSDLVIDSSTSDPPIEPGDILDGVAFSTVANDLLVLLNPNAGGLGVPSNILGPNEFDDQLTMTFGPGVNAVGFDLYGFLNQPGTLDAEFFNGSTSLGVFNFDNVTTTASFAGGIASNGDVITRVVFVNESSQLAELVDNVAFGNVVVPEPNSLFIVGFVGFCFVTQRRRI